MGSRDAMVNPRRNDMPVSYFTFGQSHAHRVNGKTFDCDCVVKIEAENPRAVMVEHFGLKWAAEYPESDPPQMRHFPRGIIELV